MYTLYLKGLGEYSHQQITRMVGIYVYTVTRYCQQYGKGGPAALSALHYGNRQSALQAYGERVAESFGRQLVAHLKEAQQRIMA